MVRVEDIIDCFLSELQDDIIRDVKVMEPITVSKVVTFSQQL